MKDKKGKVLVGIDEAGRGPVIGPMIVACFCIDEGKEERLRSLGVRDSKEIMPKKRGEIKREIEKIADAVFFIKLDNKEINKRMNSMNLNTIEAYAIATLINQAYKKFRGREMKVFIDLPSTNQQSFFSTLSSFLDKEVRDSKDVEFVLEHKADSKYLVVGAASIIAKEERDREIEDINKKYGGYGNIGSGYPSDPLTISFLKEYYKKNKKFPEEVRERWMTLDNIKEDINKKAQKKLF